MSKDSESVLVILLAVVAFGLLSWAIFASGRAYERVKFTHLINYDSSGDWLAMYGADVPFKHGDVFKIRRRDFKRSNVKVAKLKCIRSK